MTTSDDAVPSVALARRTSRHFPGESPAYREARLVLLAQEIELRRHIERVASERRSLPEGGVVPEDYVFDGVNSSLRLSELFGPHDTLITYNWMFGPHREHPCPMCTSLLSALDGEMPDILQRVAFAVIAKSPIGRMTAFARQRGWRHLPLYSSQANGFNVAYAGEAPDAPSDNAAFNVFRREGAVIRHFWGDEMGMETADPGQDPRGAPDLMPIWTILDMTPEGRGKDWRPSLEYPKPAQAQAEGQAAPVISDTIAIAKASYAAYVAKDRAAIEALLADDFHFTSPLDNGIDRATYFARCWPNSENIEGFDFVHLVADGERVFVTYEARNAGGHRFRNTEIMTIRRGKLVEVEVYFGWSLPHVARLGGFVEAKS